MDAALRGASRQSSKPDPRSRDAIPSASQQSPRSFVLLDALKACISSRDLRSGRDIHARALAAGADFSNLFLANALVSMYAKCGSLDEATTVFNAMRQRDVVSWNALMQGFVEAGDGEEVLAIFSRMRSSGCDPDARSFVAALKACSTLAEREEESKLVDGKFFKARSLERGRVLHALATKFGCESNMFVSSTLVDMYAKCGSLVYARRAFDKMRVHDVVSWNAIILGHAENEEPGLALEFFSSMQRQGCVPNSRTFVAAVKACAVLAEFENTSKKIQGKVVKMITLERGMAIHAKSGSSSVDIFVRNTLVDMYAKCGDLVGARRVFNESIHHDVVSWNAMILGYAENEEEFLALELFSSMTKVCEPNSRSLVAALKSCSSLAAREESEDLDGKIAKVKSLEKGMAVHAQAVRAGCEADVFVANTLVDMYVKCGSTEDGQSVFERTPRQSVATWSALILGYANNGQGDLGVELFLNYIQRETTATTTGLSPNSQVYNAVLKASASMGDLRASKFFHGEICRTGRESVPALGTSLVDVYGKCGSTRDAQQVFDLLARNDVVSWTALISAYAHQGDTKNVLCWFDRMRDEGSHANQVTLLCVLTACSRAGLVDKGKKYFVAMVPEFGIAPEREHYHCMIDILGRANELKEAIAMVESMPFRANSVSWMTLLDACRKWKNVEVGKLAFESLLQLDERDCAAYVVMASIYESAGMLEQQLELEIALRAKKSTRSSETLRILNP